VSVHLGGAGNDTAHIDLTLDHIPAEDVETLLRS